MRSQLEIIEQIESYIQGTMESSATAQFELSIGNSSELQELVDFQRLQIHASRRAALRLEINSFPIPPRVSIWQKFKSLFTGGLLVAGIIAGIFAFKVDEAVPEQKMESTLLPTQIPDNTRSYSATTDETSDPIHSNSRLTTVYDRHSSVSYDSSSTEHLSWLPLKEEHFVFNVEDGGIFEGDEGILVVVPENALLTKDGEAISGKVDFHLVEILKMEDIIAYNLATMSGKDPLSSGGMIRAIFEQNGEELMINPERPLTIEIPTTNYNPDMKVWEGIEEDGKVDWQNPKDLRKTLTIIDLDLLNFLPDGFEDAVSGILPYHGHTTISNELVDSLYYSLSKLENNYIPEAPKVFQPTGKKKYTFAHVLTIKPNYRRGDLPKPLQNTKITAFENDSFYCNLQTNGEGTFEIDLKGKMERDLQLVATIPGSNPSPQKVHFKVGVTPNIVFKSWKEDEEVVDTRSLYRDQYSQSSVSPSEKQCFVEPLSIKSILGEPFQQTFIATKEFEERLAAIHSLVDGDEVLSIYINNLDQPLWKCDQMAGDKLSGEELVQFRNFENQRLTNVETDGINQAKLTEYYNEKRKEYVLARNAEKEFYRNLDSEKLQALQEDLVAKLNTPRATVANTSERHNEEDKWAVLSRPNVSQVQSYKVNWYSGSWMNIDCYLTNLNASSQKVEISVDIPASDLIVYQALTSRKTLITLNRIGGNYQARFPQNDVSRSTYCLAISKQEDNFLYAERAYTPGMEAEIELAMEEVTPAELKSKLLLLDPLNNMILLKMDREKQVIAKEQKVRTRTLEIDAQIRVIIDKAEIDVAYRELLKEAISACGMPASGVN